MSDDGLESLPRAGQDPPLQARLYEVTERLAIQLVERAERDLKTPPETGGPGVRELQQVVEFAMSLLVKLPKLKLEAAPDDAGIAVLQQAMADPAKVVERLQANPKFVEALKAKGWLPPPAKILNRPNKEQAAERAAYQERLDEANPEREADDSVLQGLLKGKK